MIGELVDELRIDVHDIELGAVKQVVRDQDVIQRLRVAVEIVGVALVLGKLADQFCKHGGAGGEDTGSPVRVSGGAGELARDEIDDREELKIVQVAQHHDTVVGRRCRCRAGHRQTR